jgi:hypothetical protein
VIIVNFKIPFRKLPGVTEESHENSQSGCQVRGRDAKRVLAETGSNSLPLHIPEVGIRTFVFVRNVTSISINKDGSIRSETSVKSNKTQIFIYTPEANRLALSATSLTLLPGV